MSNRSVLILALALLGAPGFLGVATGQQTPWASPGETLTVPVTLASPGGKRGTVRFKVEPAPGVEIRNGRSRSFQWDGQNDPVLDIVISIPKAQQAGELIAARINVDWPDARWSRTDVRIAVGAALDLPTVEADPQGPVADAQVRMAVVRKREPHPGIAAQVTVPGADPGPRGPSVNAPALQPIAHQLSAAKCVAAGYAMLRVAASDRELPFARPGQSVTVHLKLDSVGGQPGTVRFTVEPARGVDIQNARSGKFDWDGKTPPVIPIVISIPKDQPPGDLMAARVSLNWRDGWSRTEVWLGVEETFDPPAPTTLRDCEASRTVIAANATPQDGVDGTTTKPVKATPAPVGQLPGTIAFGATGFGLTRRSAPEASVAANFSGKATRRTKVTFSFQRGPTQELAPIYRGVFGQTRLRGQVTHPGWRVSFGEVTSRSSALTGPAVRSNGAAFRWDRGLVVAEATVGQPTAFGEGRGGRLIQANAGVKTSLGKLTLVLSDLFRSATPSDALINQYYTAQALLEARQVDGTGFEQELQPADLQQIARLFSVANRVRGAGVQSELSLFGHHQLSIGAGTLWLTNSSDQEVSGASAEGRYTFYASRASFNARLRRTPASVPGINIPGDELAVDGRATLTDSLKVGGRAFSRSSWTLGRQTPSQTEGRSADIGYSRGRMQLDLRANYRESEFVRKRTTKTTAIDFAVPLGSLIFEAGAELGRVNDGRVVRPVEAYRSGLRWERQSSSLSVATSYNDQGLGRQFSADMAGSLNVRQFQLRGGAETSKGSVFGADSQFWAGMELPLNRDFAFVFGVDYASWDDQTSLWGDALASNIQPSPWRGTFGIRRRLTIPLSFLGLHVEQPTKPPFVTRPPAGAKDQ